MIKKGFVCYKGYVFKKVQGRGDSTNLIRCIFCFRWEVEDWQVCSQSCGRGFRTRIVKCIIDKDGNKEVVMKMAPKVEQGVPNEMKQLSLFQFPSTCTQTKTEESKEIIKVKAVVQALDFISIHKLDTKVAFHFSMRFLTNVSFFLVLPILVPYFTYSFLFNQR